jgi:hypothetical protein
MRYQPPLPLLNHPLLHSLRALVLRHPEVLRLHCRPVPALRPRGPRQALLQPPKVLLHLCHLRRLQALRRRHQAAVQRRFLLALLLRVQVRPRCPHLLRLQGLRRRQLLSLRVRHLLRVLSWLLLSPTGERDKLITQTWSSMTLMVLD